MGANERTGARIRRLRTERGLTQRQLAAPRYSAAFVSTVEAGSRTPSTDALYYFARRLEVSYDELATGVPAETAVQLGVRLADAMRVFSGGDLESAARICADVEGAAAPLRLTRLLARARVIRARCLLQRHDAGGAAELFASTEDLLDDEPLPFRVPAIAGRTRCLLLAGDVRYAAHVLETTLATLHETELTDPAAVFVLYSSLAPARVGMRAYRGAADAAAEAFAIAPYAFEPARVGAMHAGTARAYLEKQRIEDAEASLSKAYDAFAQLELRAELGWCHWARGYVQAREGRLDVAALELEGARDMLEDLGAAADIAGVQVELADVERRRGRCDAARELLEITRRRLPDDCDLSVLAGIHCQLGRVSHEQGRIADAESDLRRAAALYRDSANAPRNAASRAGRLLGDLLRDQGRLEEAAYAYRQGLPAMVSAA